MKIVFFIIQIFLLLLSSCIKNDAKEIELILESDNIPDMGMSCPTVYDKAILKVTNTNQYDTIVTLRPSHSGRDCYPMNKFIHYGFKSTQGKDTIISIERGIGSSFGEVLKDTILPLQKSFYLIDYELITSEIKMRDDVSFSQFFFPYKNLNSNEIKSFKLLIGYNERVSRITQLDFTLPERGEYFLPPE